MKNPSHSPPSKGNTQNTSLFNKILLFNDNQPVNINKMSQIAQDRVDEIRKLLDIYIKNEPTITKKAEIQKQKVKEEIFVSKLDDNQKKKYLIKKKLYELICPYDQEDERLEAVMSHTSGKSLPKINSNRGCSQTLNNFLKLKTNFKVVNRISLSPAKKNSKDKDYQKKSIFTNTNKITVFPNEPDVKSNRRSNSYYSHISNNKDFLSNSKGPNFNNQINLVDSKIIFLKNQIRINSSNLKSTSCEKKSNNEIGIKSSPMTLRLPLNSSIFDKNLKSTPIKEKTCHSRNKILSKTSEELKKLNTIRSQVTTLLNRPEMEALYKQNCIRKGSSSKINFCKKE
jgi:hypothetical protein